MGYKINLPIILKLWVYLQLLSGTQFIDNSKQSLPSKRLTNFDYMPKESKPKRKSSTNGKKNKFGDFEKPNQQFLRFCYKIEEEKSKLKFQFVVSDEKRGELVFFNKVQPLY